MYSISLLTIVYTLIGFPVACVHENMYLQICNYSKVIVFVFE